MPILGRKNRAAPGAPPWPVRVDRGHPLARGLVAAFLPTPDGLSYVDAVTGNWVGTSVRFSGDITRGAANSLRMAAPHFSGDATADRVNLGLISPADPLALAGKTTLTVLAWVHRTGGTSQFPRIIDKSNGSNAAGGWAFYLYSTASMRFITNGSTSSQHISSLVAVPLNSTTLLGYSMHSATEGRFYMGGAWLSTDGSTISAPPSNTTNAAIGNWNHSTDRMFAGELLAILVYDRALSAAEHAAAYAPATRWDMFKPANDTWFLPAASASDDLTAADLTGSAPVLDSPTVGQTHTLTAGDATSSAPALDTPTIGQTHAITAADLTGSAPVLDSPTLSEAGNNLTASYLTGSAPVLDTPTVGQTHTLTATDLASSAPTLESPTLTETTGLIAVSITSSAPALGTPAIGQTHTITAGDLTGSAPALGSPTLAESGNNLTVADLTGSAPVLDSPTIGQTHTLTASSITGSVPTFGSPTLDAVATVEPNAITIEVAEAIASASAEVGSGVALVGTLYRPAGLADTPWATSAETPQTWSVNVLSLDPETKWIDGQLVRSENRRVLMEATGPRPMEGDKITISDSTFRVMKVRPLEPGGVPILYTLEVAA